MNGSPAPSKVVLIADHRTGAPPGTAPIRRFRIARLGVDRRPLPGDGRVARLRRPVD